MPIQRLLKGFQRYFKDLEMFFYKPSNGLFIDLASGLLLALALGLELGLAFGPPSKEREGKNMDSLSWRVWGEWKLL